MELKPFKRKYKYARRNGSEGRGNLEKEWSKLRQNPHFDAYYNEKTLIKNEYPPIPSMDRDMYREWLGKISALLLQPNGSFQQYLWDTRQEELVNKMERRARGRQPRNHHWDEELGDWVKDEE